MGKIFLGLQCVFLCPIKYNLNVNIAILTNIGILAKMEKEASSLNS